VTDARDPGELQALKPLALAPLIGTLLPTRSWALGG
jgi:hypothetical protein